MQTLHCEHRNHTITASVMPHPGSPLPYAAGCLITPHDEDKPGRRLSLPLGQAFFSNLIDAQHAALAHGRWLVDRKLDGERKQA